MKCLFPFVLVSACSVDLPATTTTDAAVDASRAADAPRAADAQRAADAASADAAAPDAAAPDAMPMTWILTWSDEFDGPNGSAPNPAKWTFDTGGGGWGNAEIQSYTSRLENAVVQNGNLVITARHETFTGSDGITRDYTSARLKTQGLFAQAYGRFEARIQLPAGQGLWPAFWMLGDNIGTVGWPTCGEVDIMENIGREPAINHGTVHGPGYFGGNGISGAYTLSTGAFADDFHIFALEWDPQSIRFFVDGVDYHDVTPADLPAGTNWVFDHPFFLILNVALGGSWGGAPDSTTVFPQQMRVDYVRVYRRAP
jgi:beta-glucanase (GH16 family)